MRFCARSIQFLALAGLMIGALAPLRAVEIPLESLTPVRIGYIDLQKVFDTYPEKAFAEGDFAERNPATPEGNGERQNAINVMRQQVAADQAALDAAKAGTCHGRS